MKARISFVSGVAVLSLWCLACGSSSPSIPDGPAAHDAGVHGDGPAGGPDGPTATVHVAVSSVRSSGGSPLRERTDPPAFSRTTQFYPGWINAGSPDYVKVTLLSLDVVRDNLMTERLWEGSVELTLDGTPVDVSAINAQVQPVSTGPITAVRATYASNAKTKGTLTGIFNVTSSGFQGETKTYYTKADAAYDAVTKTGGASSATHFETGPAEEVALPLDMFNTSYQIDTPSAHTLSEGDTATVTLLFDISRMLRFYNGLNPTQGPAPGDPTDKAYFFAHTLLGIFTGSFFGTPGRIEGYQTAYSAFNQTDPNSAFGVNGWMTMVFDGSGTLVSGMLMGDDDHVLTIAKGRIQPCAPTTPDGGTDPVYDFQYDISQGTVHGFSRVSTVGHYTEMTTFDAAGVGFNGEAYFRLNLATP